MRSSLLPAARQRTVAQRAVDGARYAWPIALERALPVRRALRQRALDRATRAAPSSAVPPVTVLGIYRQRNAARVTSLLRQVPAEAEVLLWALDEVVPALAGLTVGTGPGPKFSLVNRLLAAARTPADAHIAVVDDDVCFARGDLGRLISVGARLGLDLYQPAHAWTSIFSYPLLLHRPWTLARRTTFVEIGPLFVIGPSWRDRLLPFDDEVAMGWGLDVTWSSLAASGLALGVVDDCRIIHLDPVGRSYDRTVEIDRHEELLRRLGARSVHDLMRTTRRWSA